jgi:hypothetical protein
MKRIGIDLHGVIDHYFAWWTAWIAAMVSNGDEVYIISGPPKEEIVAELYGYGLERGKHYTEVISVVDYLKEKKAHMWLDNKNTWWAEDEDWWTAKGDICAKYEVDEMWDDQARYKAGFPDGHRTKLLVYTKGYVTEGENIDLLKAEHIAKFLKLFDNQESKCVKDV